MCLSSVTWLAWSEMYIISAAAGSALLHETTLRVIRISLLAVSPWSCCISIAFLRWNSWVRRVRLVFPNRGTQLVLLFLYCSTLVCRYSRSALAGEWQIVLLLHPQAERVHLDKRKKSCKNRRSWPADLAEALDLKVFWGELSRQTAANPVC